jgi:hypothetical protein
MIDNEMLRKGSWKRVVFFLCVCMCVYLVYGLGLLCMLYLYLISFELCMLISQE